MWSSQVLLLRALHLANSAKVSDNLRRASQQACLRYESRGWKRLLAVGPAGILEWSSGFAHALGSYTTVLAAGRYDMRLKLSWKSCVVPQIHHVPQSGASTTLHYKWNGVLSWLLPLDFLLKRTWSGHHLRSSPKIVSVEWYLPLPAMKWKERRGIGGCNRTKSRVGRTGSLWRVRPVILPLVPWALSLAIIILYLFNL